MSTGREKRKTAGLRMHELVGKAQEDDDAFWGHEAWAEDEGSGNDSFRESDEDSEARKDEFDSDFNDSESDNEKAEEAVGDAEEKELQRQERSKGRKSTYIDVGQGGGQKSRGKVKGLKRVKGDGVNAGLVLNVPPAFASSTVASAAVAQPLQSAQHTTTTLAPRPQKVARKSSAESAKGSRVTLAATRERRRAQQRKLRENRSTPDPRNVASHGTKRKAVGTKKSKRRLYSQEELLLEAVQDTEPENLRWLLERKRLQESADKDKDSNLRDRNRGKVIQKYHSRRGCLITLTFPEMDAVPDILKQKHEAPAKPEPSVCVITNKPARYRDPKTQLGYHDAAAFKELRRRIDAGEPLDQRTKVEAGEPLERPNVEPSILPEPQPATVAVAEKVAEPVIHTKPSNPQPPSSNTPQNGSQMPPEPAAIESSNFKVPANLPRPRSGSVVSSDQSATISPSGERRSRRRWKPSEKALENIVNTPKLGPGLNLQPNGPYPGNPLIPDSNGSSIPFVPSIAANRSEIKSSAQIPSKSGEVVVSQPFTSQTERKASPKDGHKQNDVPGNGGGPITDTAKPVGNLKKGAASKPVGNVKKGGPASKPVGNVKKGGPASKPVGNLKKGGQASKPVGNVKKGGPASKQVGNVKKTGPRSKPVGNVKESGPGSQQKKEHIYIVPPDAENGLKEPRYITQSELIMEAILNYNRHKEERQKPKAITSNKRK